MHRYNQFKLENNRYLSWKLRVDLVKVYEIMSGTNRIDNQMFERLVEMLNSRGHSYKIRSGKFKGITRPIFYTGSERCLEHAVRGGGRSTCFYHLDRHMKNGGI